MKRITIPSLHAAPPLLLRLAAATCLAGALHAAAGAAHAQSWTDVSPAALQNPDAHFGMAWGDYDMDGDQDCYVAVSNAANILLRNDGAGVFANATPAGLADAGPTVAAAWGDYDNDGDPDLVIGQNGDVSKVFRNDRWLGFTQVAALGATATTFSVNWVDYDNDGDLDIYMVNNVEPNRLYDNQGDGTFVDVAAAAGLQGSESPQRGAAWGDFNGDGWMDVYLTVFNDDNALLVNNQDGTFTNVTASSPVLALSSHQSFGASWIDVDNDVDLDLFVTGLGQTNWLFRNDGGLFTDVTPGLLTGPDLTRGAAWGDYDGDGRIDLYVTNDGPNRLYRNLGGFTFSNETGADPVLGDGGVGTAAAWVDLDGDGDLDLTFLNNGSPGFFVRNDGFQSGTWIALELFGNPSNRSAVGARVLASSGGSPDQPRWVQPTGGAFSSGPGVLHFAFPPGDLVAEDIVVTWPGGATSSFTGVPTNRRYPISEPGPGFSDAEAVGLNYLGNGQGAAWGDYDADGDLDLYLATQGAPSVDRLYRNDGGTFVNVAAGPLADAQYSSGGAWADVDNDGDLDLFRLKFSPQILRNDGADTFVDITAGAFSAITGSNSVALGDYDNDGDVDVFIANRDLGPSLLYRNDGAGGFTDVTGAALPVALNGDNPAAAFGDYDGDGDVDLYVCGQFENNYLFQNQGDGTFTDVTTTPIDLPGLTSFGTEWIDFDNDLDLDLCVMGLGDRLWLFRNDGGGAFTDVSSPVFVAPGGGQYLELTWADYDLDGDLDAYLVQNNSLSDNILFRNDGGTFVYATASYEGNRGPLGGAQGGAFADYDEDGDQDIYVSGIAQSRFFRNEDLGSRAWVAFRLEGTTSNAAGIGAKVFAYSGGTQQLRVVGAQDVRSQEPLWAHFGLGAGGSVDSVRIEWPSGVVQQFGTLDAGVVYPILEPAVPIPVIESLSDPALRVGGLETIYVYGQNMDALIESVYLSDGFDLILASSWASVDGGTLEVTFNLAGVAPGAYALALSDLPPAKPGIGGPTLAPDYTVTLPAAVVLYDETVDLLRGNLFGGSQPDWSPPGAPFDSLLLASDRAGADDAYVKDPSVSDDGALRRLTATAGGMRDPRWSPDASTLAYIDASTGDIYTRIVGEGTGGVPFQVPLGGADVLRMDYSPTGGFLAASVQGTFSSSIHLVDDIGANSAQMTLPGSDVYDLDPSFSPDGGEIVFVRFTLVGTSLVTMSAVTGEGGGLTTILPAIGEGASYSDPAWSPDGQWIAYADGGVTGEPDIWIVNVQGPAFGQYRITNHPENDSHPTWSRDGTALAFQSNRSGQNEIYVATNLPIAGAGDSDGDGLDDGVDACPLEAPDLGEVDRDYDGCPDITSSFRFTKFWSADQLPVLYETDGVGDPRITNGSDISELQAAMAQWTGLAGLTLAGGDDGTGTGPSNAVSGDRRNSITFSDPDGYLPLTLAITPTTVALGDTNIGGRQFRAGEIVDADMLFNTTFLFSTPTYDAGAGAWDLRRLAIHEFGHFFGFGHTTLSQSTMFYVVPPGPPGAFTNDDLSLARRGYGATVPVLDAEGRILRGDGTTPVVGAAVFAISSATGDSLQMTISGMDGIYRFFALPEDFRIWVAPLDGGSDVNGLNAYGVSLDLGPIAEIDFLAEFYNDAESNDDFGAAGATLSAAGGATGIDIILNTDTEAPFVASTTPANGATDVAAVTTLLIKFNEKMDKAAFLASPDISLTNLTTMNGVGGAVTFLQKDSLLVFTPNVALDYGTSYELTVGPAIVDVSGNPMAAPELVTFTVENAPPLVVTAIAPNEAPVGATVTVTGTGFDPVPANNTVAFNGASAIPIAGNAVSLTVVVPPGALSGTVYTVITPPDTSLGGAAFTVVPPKEPPYGNLVDAAPLSGDPRKLAVRSDGGFAYVATAQGVDAVDALPTSPSFLAVTPIPMAGGATGVAALPGGTRAVAVGPTQPRIRLIDTDSSSPTFNLVIDDAGLIQEPLGTAAMAGGTQVLVAFSDRVVLCSASASTLGDELREWALAGTSFTGDLAVAADGTEAYASTAEGKIAVLGLLLGEEIVALLPTGTSPREVAVNPLDGSALGVDGFGVSRRYESRGPLTDQLVLAGGYRGLAVSPEGAFAYAANYIDNEVDVLDLQGGGLGYSLSFPVGIDPVDLATAVAGRYIYVAVAEQDRLEIYDTQAGLSLARVSPSSAGPGALVTLAGTGFDPVAANNLVTIGGATHVPLDVDASGTRLLVQILPGASGAVQVRTGGLLSNTVPFTLVSRPTTGAFLFSEPIDTPGSATGSEPVISPSGKLMVVLDSDGGTHAVTLDPARADFYRERQYLTPAQSGFTSPTSFAFSGDGRKLYVASIASQTVEILDVDENASSPLSYRGRVQLGGADLVDVVRGLSASTDGRSLFAIIAGGDRIVIDAATDEAVIPGNPSNPQGVCGAVHPNGLYYYVGAPPGGGGCSILVFDADPESPNYMSQIGVAIGITGFDGPYYLETSRDGRFLYAVTRSGGPTTRYICAVDIDPDSPSFHTEVATADLGTDLAALPTIRMNHGGTILFAFDSSALTLRAYEPSTLSFLGFGPLAAPFAADRGFAISRDDAMIYLPFTGEQIVGIDVTGAGTPIPGAGLVQTGVAGQPLPVPLDLTFPLTGGNSPQGSVVAFRVAPGTDGDFGYGDGQYFAIADADGRVTAPYTVGPDALPDNIDIFTVVGNLSASIVALADTSLTPPQIVKSQPEPGSNILPGVNTLIAVDFSKAIDPATVGNSTFVVRPQGGSALAGRYTYAENQRRIVFNPETPLAYSSAYEFELTSGLTDYNGNPLTNPTTVSFTTEGAPAPTLTALDAPAARAGAPVVLSGAGLGATPAENAVLFGAVPAPVLFADPGAITVIVPQGAVTGPVTVTVGGQTTNALSFVVLPTLSPPVDSLLADVSVPTSGQQIAIVPDGSRAYMTSSGADAVVPIDILAQVAEPSVPVGKSPFGVTADPNGGRVFVSNYFSNTVSVIDADPASTFFHQVVATLRTGLNPTGLASHPDGRTLYVCNFGDSTLTIFDTDPATASVYGARANINTGSGTQSVVVTPDGAWIVVGTGTGILLLDSQDGAARANINTGSGTQSVVVTPDGGLAVVLTTDGQLILIDIVPGSPTEGQARANINTGSGSQSVVVTPDGAFLYVTKSDGFVDVYQIVQVGGSAARIERPALGASIQIVPAGSIEVGENPAGMAFDPSGRPLLLVVNSGSRTVSFLTVGTLVPPIRAWADVQPNTLNLKSKGNHVTGYVQFPVAYDPAGVDEATVRMNGVLAPVAGKTSFTDVNEDGIPEIAFKFSRQELFDELPQGEYVPVTITGRIDGKSFVAEDTVRVLRPVIKAPKQNDLLFFGETAQVEWDPIPQGNTHHVDIYWTTNDGIDWLPVATGEPDDGSFAWTVPDSASTECRLLVAAYDQNDEVLGVGYTDGAFTVTSLLDEPRPGLPTVFAVLPASPNPFSAGTVLRFDLPAEAQVSLQIFGVDGSLVRTLKDSELLPAGRHESVWDGEDAAGRPAAQGVYFVRVRTDAAEAVRRVIRLQ